MGKTRKPSKRNAGKKVKRTSATKRLTRSLSKKGSQSTIAGTSSGCSGASSSKTGSKNPRLSGPMPSGSAESCIMCECEECEQNRQSVQELADSVSDADLDVLLGHSKANNDLQTTCSQPCFSLGQTWQGPMPKNLTPRARKSAPNLVAGKNRIRKTKLRRKLRKRFKTSRKGTNLLKYVLKKKVPRPGRRSAICKDSQRFSFQCPCCRKFYMALQRLRDISMRFREDAAKVSDAHLPEGQCKYMLQAPGTSTETTTPMESAGGKQPSILSTRCEGLPRRSYMLPAIWKDMNKHFGKRKDDRQKCARRPGEEHFISSVFFPSAGVNWGKEAAKSSSGKDKKGNSRQAKGASSSGNVQTNAIQMPTYEDLVAELEDGNQQAPMPSGQATPTFIAMVKTAIRDLKPFNVTSVEAISKYVQIRYHVVNDHLLRYILKWMVDLGVLRCVSGQYSFTHKRLVKKATVAVLRDKGRRRRALKRRKHGKLRLRRSKRRPRRKRLGGGKRRKRKRCMRRAGRRPRKHKRAKSKGDSKQERCTCSKEITSTKNRVKVRTRYIRRQGKIYKQDEYV